MDSNQGPGDDVLKSRELLLRAIDILDEAGINIAAAHVSAALEAIAEHTRKTAN